MVVFAACAASHIREQREGLPLAVIAAASTKGLPSKSNRFPVANFGLIGAAGYIAPRHMEAVRATNNQLVAAVDPHDSVGILDSYFPDCAFFTEIERFDRHIERLRRRGDEQRVHYMSVCSPNYLHDAHVRLALRVKAHAICEKPLAANPWGLDGLREVEAETGCRVFTVLQLRVHPALVALRERIRAEATTKRDVVLTYVTKRGKWYHYSWKGDVGKSGGVTLNIGVHFFDLLMWLFGPAVDSEVHILDREKAAGALELESARVRWFLSVDGDDLPAECHETGQRAFRSITVDGEELEFSNVFKDLHTSVYEDILAGGGFGIEDARPAIELTHEIRESELITPRIGAHPFLAKK